MRAELCILNTKNSPKSDCLLHPTNDKQTPQSAVQPLTMPIASKNYVKPHCLSSYASASAANIFSYQYQSKSSDPCILCAITLRTQLELVYRRADPALKYSSPYNIEPPVSDQPYYFSDDHNRLPLRGAYSDGRSVHHRRITEERCHQHHIPASRCASKLSSGTQSASTNTTDTLYSHVEIPVPIRQPRRKS